MTDVRHVRLSQFVRRCVGCIEDAGLKVRFGQDFDELAEIVRREESRSPLAPIFDPDCGHTGRNKAFWLTVCDRRGNLVVTEALMLVDIGADNLAGHLGKHLDWYRPPRDRVSCGLSTISLTSAARLTGRLVYNGEMWVKAGEDGFRGSSLIGLTPRAAMAVALVKWEPDHVFAFVEPGSALKGLTARAGFIHLEQGSIDWHDNTRPAPLQEWITWIDADDADHLMAVSPERLNAMLGGIPRHQQRTRDSASAA